MKLIDLMIQEGIEWPKLAAVAMQDDDGKIKFAIDDNVSLSCGLWHRVGGTESAGGSVNLTELASDWSAAIITRKQYEAAQAKAGFDELEKPSAGAEQSGQQASELDAEIERTLVALGSGYTGDTLEIINSHLDALYDIKREWLKGEFEPQVTGAFDIQDFELQAKDEPLNITDWRDLQVGDIISVGGNLYAVDGSATSLGGSSIRIPHTKGYLLTNSGYWEFIHRPS